MENDIRQKRAKNYSMMRSVIDFTMGVVIVAVGVFMIVGGKLGFAIDNFDITFRYIFASICGLYGFWRIYRGFKKEDY